MSPPSNPRTRDWQEPLVWLSLLVFFLLVRLRTLEPIEIGGDAIQKWFFVRRWAYQSPFDGTAWNHHFTRMGDNVPVYLIQRLLGTDPWVYYVGPTLAFLIAAFMVYVVGKRVGGRLTGVLGALAFTLFKPMRRAASQMLPSAFSCMYVMLGTYFLVRYAQDESDTRRRWLWPCALSLFGGYLSHEPNVFFVPAFALIVWLYGRNLRHLALFLGILLAGFCLETATYASLTEYPSRLHITMKTHLGSSPGLKIDGFWGLFGRFRTSDFGPDFQRYFYFFPFAAIGVALLARARLAKLLALLPLCFLFLTTFLVRGIDPIRTLASFQSRYLVAAVPLIALTNALFFTSLGCFVWRGLGSLAARVPRLVELRDRGRRWFARPEPVASGASERTHAGAFVGRWLRFDLLWVVPLLMWFGAPYYPEGGFAASLDEKHPLVAWRNTQAVITDAYRRHLPIVGPRNALWAAHYLYIDDATLLENGRLPLVSDKLGAYDKKRMFLSSDPARYEAEIRSKRKSKSARACVLDLRRNNRFLGAPTKALPEHCQALGS